MYQSVVCATDMFRHSTVKSEGRDYLHCADANKKPHTKNNPHLLVVDVVIGIN